MKSVSGNQLDFGPENGSGRGRRQAEGSGAGRGTEPPRERDAVVLAGADCSDHQHFNTIHSTVGHWLPTVRARGRVEQTTKLGGA